MQRLLYRLRWSSRLSPSLARGQAVVAGHRVGGKETSGEYEVYVVNGRFDTFLGEEKVWGMACPSDGRASDDSWLCPLL